MVTVFIWFVWLSFLLFSVQDEIVLRTKIWGVSAYFNGVSFYMTSARQLSKAIQKFSYWATMDCDSNQLRLLKNDGRSQTDAKPIFLACISRFLQIIFGAFFSYFLSFFIFLISFRMLSFSPLLSQFFSPFVCPGALMDKKHAKNLKKKKQILFVHIFLLCYSFFSYLIDIFYFFFIHLLFSVFYPTHLFRFRSLLYILIY